MIVEPGNLESILRGRIIEFETGLTKDESQLLSHMLQIDHIVLFDEKISPHQEYYYGGRCYAQINLKIINTISGEIIFQSSKQWGIYFPDPRPTFSHIGPRPSQEVLNPCERMVLAELLYAFGETATGLNPKVYPSEGPFIVGKLLINSPAYKAGIKEDDKVLEIGGVGINSWDDYGSYIDNIRPEQGDTLKIKVKRAGKIFELDLEYPVIPMYPIERRYRQEEQTGKNI
jgi:hypothetical protein